MTPHFGPPSSVSSSSFISCTAEGTGGGFFHNSPSSSSSISISNTVFTNNCADFTYTEWNFGGGAFEDCHSGSYNTQLLFSFFTKNTAPIGKGNDISIVYNALSPNPLTYCFTTTSSQSFWNQYYYEENWLPLTTITIVVFNALDYDHKLSTCNKTHVYVDYIIINL